jgi:ribose transport system ATP-binding protein
LIGQSRIILFDEPTQGVDIGAKQEIYKIIQKLVAEGTSVIVASSEINELQEICNRILVMFRGSIVGEFRDPGRQKEEILN